jgi:hypothetical protein
MFHNSAAHFVSVLCLLANARLGLSAVVADVEATGFINHVEPADNPRVLFLRNQRKSTKALLQADLSADTEEASSVVSGEVTNIPAAVVVLMSVVTSGLVVLITLSVGARLSSPVPKGDEAVLQEALKEAHAKADTLAKELQDERIGLRQAHLEEVEGVAQAEAAKMQESAQQTKEELKDAGNAALETARAASEKAAQSIKVAMKAQEVLNAEVDCIRARAEAFAVDEKNNLIEKMDNIMQTIGEDVPMGATLSAAFQSAKAAMDQAEMEAGEGPPVAVIVTFRMTTMRFAKMDDAQKADFKVRLATAFSADLSSSVAAVRPNSAPVTPASVNVTVEDTSTKVTAKILPPRGANAESVKNAIASSATLKESIVQQVSSMPNIEAFIISRVSATSISGFTSKTEAEWDQFDLPPPGIIIAGAFAPGRLQSLHASTTGAVLYHLSLAIGCGACMFLDRDVACTKQNLVAWVYLFLGIQVLSVLSQLILRLYSAGGLQVLKQMEEDRQEQQVSLDLSLAGGTAIMAAMKDFKKSFAPYNQALAKHDEITSTWAYFWTQVSGAILIIIGVFGTTISVQDVLLDEEFCPMHHVLVYVHVYSFIFLFSISYNIVWLLGWIATTAVGCGSGFVTKLVINTARALDKDVPMKLPIFTSLAQSFVLRNGSQQYKLAVDNHEEEIERLERKLLSLETDLDKKRERMQAIEDMSKEEDLGKLDDPTMLTKNLERAIAEVEPVVVFAASMSAANLEEMAAEAQEAAQAASAELQKLADETGATQAAATLASEAQTRADAISAQAKAAARSVADQAQGHLDDMASSPSTQAWMQSATEQYQSVADQTGSYAAQAKAKAKAMADSVADQAGPYAAQAKAKAKAMADQARESLS